MGTATRDRAPLVDEDALDDLVRAAVGRVRGRVLEVGAGDGENFGAFDPSVEWIGLEPDADRRAELATRAREWGHRDRAPLDAVCESIPLPDASVDAVVGTYMLCSVTDPAAALAEVRRVLVPGGRVVFADHVASPPGTLHRAVQRLATPLTVRFDHGCHLDRDTRAALDAAGFVGDAVTSVRVGPMLRVPVLLFEGHAS
ncbi:class I SAM-dependent methyltransferase [Agromyces sp. SYSU T00194]|uniref:class I SAM-dependent methyltransferase n=1 Tax=Agromyces chitinivorans TaxID=3158560 RepID=UPI0033910C1E